MIWLLLIPPALLAGSIPFGLLIARAKGVDIRSVGSGNIGATNVGRILGRRYFFLCFFLDSLKGFAPTLVAGLVTHSSGRLPLEPRDSIPWLVCMVAPVLGHVFSPWLKFKGGKGVATGVGAIVAIYPALTIPGVGALLIFLAMLKIFRYASLAAMTATCTLPVLVALHLFWAAPALGLTTSATSVSQAAPFVGVAVLLAALIVWTHRTNIRRLRAGTEPKVGHKPPIKPASSSP